MNLTIDSFQVDKKPNVDCSRQKPFICRFRCRSPRLPLIFYLKFANINFPCVRKGRRMENNSVRVKTWGVFLFFTSYFPQLVQLCYVDFFEFLWVMSLRKTASSFEIHPSEDEPVQKDFSLYTACPYNLTKMRLFCTAFFYVVTQHRH